MWEARKYVTLVDLRLTLAEMCLDVSVSVAGLHRFFARQGVTRKKMTGHAIEQDRPDVLQQRQRWFKGQLDLDPECLVFIDGSAAEAEGNKPGPLPISREAMVDPREARGCAWAFPVSEAQIRRIEPYFPLSHGIPRVGVTPSFPPAGIRAGRLFCASARLKQWAA